MQGNIEIGILTAGYENLKSSLMVNLEAKGRYIRDARQKELTEAIVRRMNSEEKHIKLCIGTNEAAENLIKALQVQVHVLTLKIEGLKKKEEFFYNEAKEYRPYYEEATK